MPRHPSSPEPRRKKLLLERLEDRLLFDGVSVQPVPVDAEPSAQSAAVSEAHHDCEGMLGSTASRLLAETQSVLEDTGHPLLATALVEAPTQEFMDSAVAGVQDLLDQLRCESGPNRLLQEPVVEIAAAGVTGKEGTNPEIAIAVPASVQVPDAAEIMRQAALVLQDDRLADSTDVLSQLLSSVQDQLSMIHEGSGPDAAAAELALRDLWSRLSAMDLSSRDVATLTDVQAQSNPASGSVTDESDDETTGPAASANRPTLIVYNANITDGQQLVDQLRASAPDQSFDVLRLDTNRDGVAQLTEYLNDSSEPYATVYFLVHGADGVLELGATFLTAGNLGNFEEQVSQWQGGLTSDADLLFFGCDVAQSERGQSVIRQLADLTAADVAASINPTGSAALGGDWQLEYTVGQIDSMLPLTDEAMAEWNHLLGFTPLDGGIGAFAVSQDNRLYSVNFDTGKATLLFTDTALTGINSLGFDSVNGIYYYADNASGSKALYGWDAPGRRVAVRSDDRRDHLGCDAARCRTGFFRR